MNGRFSSRHGFEPPATEITVRNDAPYNLRGVVVDLAYEAGLDPHSMRSVVCSTLRVREAPYNWTAYPNVNEEVRQHLNDCHWYQVYDIIEATYNKLLEMTGSGFGARDRPPPPDHFERELNTVFRRDGIGWQLVRGEIQVRGEEAFEDSIREADAVLANSGRVTASKEIHQALSDLSRRPEPDVTGALQHGLVALECVLRDVCGDPKATLGSLLSRYRGVIPAPLDQAVEKIWGFASEQGRHVREGREPDLQEAELVVHVAAAVAVYLTRRHGP